MTQQKTVKSRKILHFDPIFKSVGENIFQDPPSLLSL